MADGEPADTIHPHSGIQQNVTLNNPIASAAQDNSGNLLVDNVIVTKQNADEVTATVTFVDDANVVKNDNSSWATPNKSLYTTSEQMISEQSVKEFLAKPIVLSSGTFSTTDTLTSITSINCPYSITGTSGGAMWREKLKGYFGIRMTMNFRLVVNANRFQQGRYILSFTHFGGSSANGTKTPLINSHLRLPTLVQRTTVKHVELDLNCDTAAELSIPYVSVRTFYPIHELINVPAGNTTILGYVNIYPYSPLVAVSGSTVAPYKLYCWFTDVELIGAASPQSGLSDQEVSNRTNGILSGPLSAVSRGFREFEDIPLLSSYARSISWVSDRLARSAAIFGLSKPLQGDSLMKINPISAPSHTTVDGDSDARSLGMMSKPGVLAIDGLSGNQYDEMDFSFIAQKFAWFGTVNWSTADLVDVILSSITVTPNKNLVTAGPCYNMTPVCYIANNFRKWRGSLKFRFKIVKTEFHSGRLSFNFYPNLPGILNGSTPDYVNRVIVDIREHSEVEIVVPYTSNAMYTDISHHLGFLTVQIIDPLVAPATVSGTISILMEIAGGPDFEVFTPRFSNTPQAVVPQSGMSNECKIYSHTIGATQINSNPTLSSSVASGERISNFRATIKRYTPMRYNAFDALVYDNYTISVLADALPIRASDTTPKYIDADHYAAVASCYAIVGGGVRIRDVVSSARMTNTRSPLQAFLVTEGNSTSSMLYGNGNIASPDTNFNSVIQEVTHNSIVSVEVPQYSIYTGKATADLFIGDGFYVYNPNGTFGTGNANTVKFVVSNYNGPITVSAVNTAFHSVYRSGADDANFYCFVSIPPLIGHSNSGWIAGF